MTEQTAAHEASSGNKDDASYDRLLRRLQASFMSAIDDGKSPLFTTDATGLWEIYLNSFDDPVERQHHNCNTCRHFIERFGGLVTIDAAGIQATAVWSDAVTEGADPAYAIAFRNLGRSVRRAKVTGVFKSSLGLWGTGKTGDWSHLALIPPSAIIHNDRVLDAGQAMAAKAEDFKTVSRALGEFEHDHITTALRLLRSNSLFRSEKVLGQAEWLDNIYGAMARANNKDNVLWRFVATAPAGFCHPRSSMIGTLLEDISSGLGFDEVSKRFAEKMNPTIYQRPQAAPTSGAIEAAEKLVEKLGIAKSLARRFATMSDIRPLWLPKAKAENEAPVGVFGSIKPKTTKRGGSELVIPETIMTWVKFCAEVLPGADRIQVMVPSHNIYTSLLTTVDPDAPPILQWDSDGARNPVSWYVYSSGSTASSFGLTGGTFADLKAITLKPNMWVGDYSHHGKGVVLVIDGAADNSNPGMCLFPEILRKELHGARSVIEAYSRANNPSGHDEQGAAGLLLNDNKRDWDIKLRAWSGGSHLDYKLDRWD